ncbi:PREDICTED: EF-hand calcium-binding domain-containing protein 9 [Charadrius vociferus]|uniref:EF-hand calcium-binding domain-containing protein 9 n=1 Tax=Charadrius vociferus TaxID=50402 RepID=UPI0005215AE8|nr:PREDICTED: EF-hand calcium-binding domain-containing protein 9 [Charadrius vociferus]
MVTSITIAPTAAAQTSRDEAEIWVFSAASCLDEMYCLLPVRNAAALVQSVQLLDVHRNNYLKNLQFYCFLCYVTDLTKDQIMLLFDTLDQNVRGRICFNEFYMVVRIVPSHEVHTLQILQSNRLKKQFTHQQAGCALQRLDVDTGNRTDFNEFEATSFLFSIQKEQLKKIFKDFDISGNEQLNYGEFKMLAVFCIDKQQRKEKWTGIASQQEQRPPKRLTRTLYAAGDDTASLLCPRGSAYNCQDEAWW